MELVYYSLHDRRREREVKINYCECKPVLHTHLHIDTYSRGGLLKFVNNWNTKGKIEKQEMPHNMHSLPHTSTLDFPQIHWLWTVSATRCFCCPSALLPFFIYPSLTLLWLLSICFQNNSYIRYKEEQRQREK